MVLLFTGKISFPIISLFILTFIIWMHLQINKSSKLEENSLKEFLDKENLANSTRKKDISSLDYITISYDSLPFYKYNSTNNLNILNSIKIITELLDSNEKFLNLHHISNTDLKINYGVANFEKLSIYENNFNILTKNLNTWGLEVFNENDLETAQEILEFAVNIGSEYKQTFETLAKIYKNNSPEKIEELIKKVKTFNIINKDIIINSLLSIYNN